MCDSQPLGLKLAKSGNSSHQFPFLPLHAVLGTQLEPFANPQRSHAQCARSNAEDLSESTAVPQFISTVALIIVQNQVASFE